MNLPNPTPYRTLVEASNKLMKQGFTENFKLEANGKLEALGTHKSYEQHEIEVVEIHRFEGASNPSDMSVLFAVKCADGTQGMVVSSYGANADHELLDFMESVPIDDRTDVAGH